MDDGSSSFDQIERTLNAADTILDGICDRPLMYGTQKSELVAIAWTAMTIQSSSQGRSDVVRKSRAKLFPGNQRISVRYPGMKIPEFAKTKLRPWIEEYRSMLNEE